MDRKFPPLPLRRQRPSLILPTPNLPEPPMPPRTLIATAALASVALLGTLGGCSQRPTPRVSIAPTYSYMHDETAMAEIELWPQPYVAEGDTRPLETDLK